MRISRWILLVTLALSFLACSKGDDVSESAVFSQDSLQKQDLASELGADEMGMKKYVLVFLKAGPNRGQDSTEAAKLQEAHMSNIRRLAEKGKLIMAGPFLEDGILRGLYLFDVATIEEARELTETDPAIQAGRLQMEMHSWYGPAALMKVAEIQEQIMN